MNFFDWLILNEFFDWSDCMCMYLGIFWVYHPPSVYPHSPTCFKGKVLVLCQDVIRYMYDLFQL